MILTDLEGVAVGEKLNLHELQDLLLQDKKNNTSELSDAEKDALIKTLEGHRQLKDTGMRISNRAASQDVHGVMENIYAEVSCAFIVLDGITDIFHTEA
jgi:hypothetical protein